MESKLRQAPEANMNVEPSPKFKSSASPAFSTEAFSLPLDAITEWDELDLLPDPFLPHRPEDLPPALPDVDFSAWPMLDPGVSSNPREFSTSDFLSVAEPAFEPFSFSEPWQANEPSQNNTKLINDETKRYGIMYTHLCGYTKSFFLRVLQDLQSKVSAMESRLERVEKYTLNNDNRLMALNVNRKLDEVMEEVQSSKADMKTLQTGLRSLIRVLAEEEEAGR
jgi:hypothetical protein